MKVSKAINWLSKSQFQPQFLGNPIELTIQDYTEEENAKGINRRIVARHANGKDYSFDIFGDVLNVLIDNLGDDSDLWKGKKIRVMLVMKGDKEIKQITVVKL
jgi:hypothetical protein